MKIPNERLLHIFYIITKLLSNLSAYKNFKFQRVLWKYGFYCNSYTNIFFYISLLWRVTYTTWITFASHLSFRVRTFWICVRQETSYNMFLYLLFIFSFLSLKWSCLCCVPNENQFFIHQSCRSKRCAVCSGS